MFLDEDRQDRRGHGRVGAGDVLREAVPVCDLLPSIEGIIVSEKHGVVKNSTTSCSIASGVFYIAKPSGSVLPELQAELLDRVELEALTRDDMRLILPQPEASLIKQ